MTTPRVIEELAYDKWRDRLEVVDGLVPLCDEDAWFLSPYHRWLHNKLELTLAQGDWAYPHGILPEEFPCFSKPIYNAWGCSTGARVVETADDLVYTPGHFTLPLYAGEQRSIDLVLLGGQIVWHRTMLPVIENGSFVGWRRGSDDPISHVHVHSFVQKYLSVYSGVFNFETIGTKIIEAHPRCSVEFIDFFGEEWLNSVVRLYGHGSWIPPSAGTPEDYQGVWRTDLGSWIPTLDVAKVKELEKTEGIYSIFLPYLPGQPLNKLNPDGENTWRIALVSGKTRSIVESVITQLKDTI